MTEPVSIIIPAFNQLHYCRQCIESIRRSTEYPYRLILVDNGSTDGVGEYFDSVAGAVAVHAPENLGFAGGVNLGIERATGHVVLLNNDTIVPREWLTRLAFALESDIGIGIVGPMSNQVSGSQQIDGLNFETIEEINEFSEHLARSQASKVRDVARLVGFCMLIRQDTLAKVGCFDEGFGIGNFEDDDYCLRTLRAGYRLCVAEDAFVFHFGSRTFLGMGLVDEAWSALIADNEGRFAGKWQVRPEERCDAVQQARQYNRRAREAQARGEVAEAVRWYKEAIACAPAYDLNYNDLGVLLWEEGDLKRAFEQFRRAVRFNLASEDARANLSEAGRALGREAEARALLDGDCSGGGA